MDEEESLSHTKWEGKYHEIWIPKYRKQKFFAGLREDLGAVFHALAQQKECRILERHGNPPKSAVSSVVGFIKVKNAIYMARHFSGRRRNFVGESFWARGFYVTTVGFDEDLVRNYI
jgi:putative transposase